ncbi:MAG: ECF-type sigma factor [Phycisphaerales bacterium]
MSEPDVTQLLIGLADGNDRASDHLLPLVYDELKRLARHHLDAERVDHTLQATALVHEAYLRLVDQDRVQWRNRAHFVAIGAQAMRRILVDHARGRRRLKRGGTDRHRISLDRAIDLAAVEHGTDLISLDDAMQRLAEAHPDKVRVVEMRFFGGLTTDETAAVLGVTSRTVERHWQFARAWLFRSLEPDAGDRSTSTDANPDSGDAPKGDHR